MTTRWKYLDEDETARLLRQAVSILGRTYEYSLPTDVRVEPVGECFYRHGDQPGCLVGWALYFAGWTLAELGAIEESSPVTVDHPENTLTDRQRDLWTSRVSPQARLMLYRAQRHQDAGKPWGEAVDLAIQETRGVAVAA